MPEWESQSGIDFANSIRRREPLGIAGLRSGIGSDMSLAGKLVSYLLCGLRPVLFSAFCLCLIADFAFAGEIDRLIVAVNGRVLTQGDLDLARNLQAIIFYDRSTEPGSRSDQIHRLVDQELMRQESSGFSMTHEDETRVQARLQSLREAYAGKGGFLLVLRRLGLQESELVSYLRRESSVLRFVDFRFRPFVRVTEEETKNYYGNRLIPQLQQSGLDRPALAEVTAQIEVILREEKLNAILDQWMREIRRNSRIEYFDVANNPMASAPESKPK